MCGKYPKLFPHRIPRARNVIRHAHRRVNHQRRLLPTRALSGSPHRGQSRIPYIRMRAHPANRANPLRAAHLERARPQRRRHHRHLRGRGQRRLSNYLLPLKIYFARLQQPLQHLYILGQMTQRSLETDAESLLHRLKMPRSHAKPQPSRRNRVNSLRLSRRRNRMPRPRLHYRSAQLDALRLRRRNRHSRQRIPRIAPRRQPRRFHPYPLRLHDRSNHRPRIRSRNRNPHNVLTHNCDTPYSTSLLQYLCISGARTRAAAIIAWWSYCTSHLNHSHLD